MFCANCSKLAMIPSAKKPCHRCQKDVTINLSVICEGCSFKDKVCTVCLRKIDDVAQQAKANLAKNGANPSGGCGCRKKK